MIKVEWLGHACFKISDENYSIVIDPFCKVYGLEDVETAANQVICTHNHYDHAFMEGVKIIDSDKKAPFKMEIIPTYHDKAKGLLRGKNNIVKIVWQDFTIVHLGDIGCNLTMGQVESLKNANLLLIPVGGVYTINNKEAKEIIEKLQPKTTIPMHYKSGDKGLRQIADIMDFISLFDKVKKADSNEIIFPNNESEKIVILKME